MLNAELTEVAGSLNSAFSIPPSEASGYPGERAEKNRAAEKVFGGSFSLFRVRSARDRAVCAGRASTAGATRRGTAAWEKLCC